MTFYAVTTPPYDFTEIMTTDIMDVNTVFGINDTSNDTIETSGSLETNLTLLTFVLFGVLLPGVIPLGNMGNILNLVVLRSKDFSESSSVAVYLRGLSVSDVLLLLFTIYYVLVFYPSLYQDELFGINFQVIWPFHFWVENYALNTSQWLVIIVTVERYISIKYPLKARLWFTTKRSKIKVVVLNVVMLIYTFPRVLEFEQTSTYVRAINSTMWVYQYNPTRFPYLSKVYWTLGSILTVVPVVMVAVSNALLMQVLNETSKKRKKMNVRADDNSGNDRSMSILLVSMATCYTVCYLPSAAMVIVDAFEILDEENRQLNMAIFYRVSGFLVTLNAAVNFWLYCACSRKYRGALAKMCSRRST